MTNDAFAALVEVTDAAMIVVTVAVGGDRDGCLVGFHAQCSIDPPRYAVWLSVANRTFELAERASHLGVHVLGSGDHDLAALFGGETGDEVDKLDRCDWAPGPGGAPLLPRCPARFAGRVVERGSIEDGGDHVRFVLEPVAPQVRDGLPARPLRLSQVTDIHPGHAPNDRR